MGEETLSGSQRCNTEKGYRGPRCALCRTPDFIQNDDHTCSPCNKAAKDKGVIVLSVLGVVGVTAVVVAAFFGKKLYDYLSIKGENGESNMDMLVAFRGRVQDYLDDNRDYFKVPCRPSDPSARHRRPTRHPRASCLRCGARVDVSDALLCPLPPLPAAQVVLNFLQICTQQLGGAISVDWPEGYSRAMSRFNIVNLNVLSRR